MNESQTVRFRDGFGLLVIMQRNNDGVAILQGGAKWIMTFKECEIAIIFGNDGVGVVGTLKANRHVEPVSPLGVKDSVRTPQAGGTLHTVYGFRIQHRMNFLGGFGYLDRAVFFYAEMNDDGAADSHTPGTIRIVYETGQHAVQAALSP